MIAAVHRASTSGDRGRAGSSGARGRWAVALGLAASLGGCAPGDPPPQTSAASTGDETGTGTHAASSTSDAASGEASSDASTGAPASGWEPSLELGDDVGALLCVWGPEPGLLYAVAGQPLGGGLSRGTLLRWDGAQWSVEPLPDDVPGLNWVHGVGERRVLVGDLGVVLVRDGDEGPWAQHGCGTVLPLWGVWGAAEDDVWAVGGDGFNRDPVACHFDGTTWALHELPEPSIESHALYKVWGTAADDVWAVGDAGLVMHWGGPDEGWVEHPSGTEFDLISLWGTGPGEILAVGGRTTGVLSRWDGVQWTAQEAAALPGLNGVWMAPDGTATVVGPQGGAGTVAPGALSVDVEDAGTGLALHGVYGLPGVERWAVGGSLDMAPPYVGIVLHRMP
jgi:hypothetical protein